MTSTTLPEYCRPIVAEQQLRFACHPGVRCFTECCRELDLVLTPYDVLRLRRSLGVSSADFLARYVLVEWDEQQVFPICYLTMVDDGRASCIFVRDGGCSVYADRPGSCRAYPIGRGAARTEAGPPVETLVVLQEPHCLGFAEPDVQTAGDYLRDQGLADYNRCNDALLDLVQHAEVRAGRFRPSRRQVDQYMLALYDLDAFRKALNDGRLSLADNTMTPSRVRALTGDNEELLLLGIRWLIHEFFPATPSPHDLHGSIRQHH